MSKSENMRLRDVRAAFRLVGEVVELGVDPHEWWPHLLEQLCQLTGAAKAIGGELEGLFFVDPQVHLLGNFFARFEQSDVDLFRHFVTSGKWMTIDEGGERYYRLRGHGAPLAVRSAEQLMAPPRWRRSEMFSDYFRPSHIDDRVFSFCQGLDGRRDGGAVWNGITLFRGLGDRPFTAHQRRLLRLVHGELRPLIGTKVASLRGAPARPLSRRLRQMLDLLLRGHSEKQIAEQSGLAKSTVNEYVSALYQRYGVSSRPELMARFLRWRGNGRGSDSTIPMPDDR